MKEEGKNSAKIPKSNGENFRATYENYEVACPICEEWNVFNRVTDIKSIGAACGKRVWCSYCGRDFSIIADDIEEKYEYFLRDYDEFLVQKKYMQCILTLCQACEAFFMKCIEIKLLWEPYRSGVFGIDDSKFSTFCDFREEIDREFSPLNYQRLLNIFYDLYLNDKKFRTQQQIVDYLSGVRAMSKKEPSDSEMSAKCEGKRAEAVLMLKRLDINEVRNKIAHKDGYRPTLSEVENYHSQVVVILNDIVAVFDLGRILQFCNISNVTELLGR